MFKEKKKAKENEIKIYKGKKRVRKGKIFRKCCSVELCTNRTGNIICKTHIQKLKYVKTEIIHYKSQNKIKFNTDGTKEIFEGKDFRKCCGIKNCYERISYGRICKNHNKEFKNSKINEIRFLNGKKQVLKKCWRPCCNIFKCTNRTQKKKICKEHIKKLNDPIKKHLKKIKKHLKKIKKHLKKIKENEVEGIKLNQTEKNYLCAGIYLYTFLDGKKYVGQTRHTILYRTREHCREAYKNTRGGCPLLNNKIKYTIESCNTKNPTLEDWLCIFFEKVRINILEQIDQEDESEEDYLKKLNNRESFFIRKYNCFKCSKEYDGSQGLNLTPGNKTEDIRKRNENNCYDHHNNLLISGIESIKIRGKIIGYKSRIRGKFENTITIGNSIDATLDEKLSIAKEFRKLQIICDNDEIIKDFKKKYKLKNKSIKGKKIINKTDHNGNELDTGIYFNKEYFIFINRDGVCNNLKFGDIENLDEQLKTCKDIFKRISKLSLDDKSLLNMNFTKLKSKIKNEKLPILTTNYKRERLSRWSLYSQICRFQNVDEKQDVINEFENAKKWHRAHGFPEGWSQMWGNINNRKNEWIDTGYRSFKSPDNIIFSCCKNALDFVKYINEEKPKTFTELENGLKKRKLWKKSKGWKKENWSEYSFK